MQWELAVYDGEHKEPEFSSLFTMEPKIAKNLALLACFAMFLVVFV
jgi:hypothetical protein